MYVPHSVNISFSDKKMTEEKVAVSMDIHVPLLPKASAKFTGTK